VTRAIHGLAHAIAVRDALEAELSNELDRAADLRALAATAAERAGDMGRLDAELYLSALIEVDDPPCRTAKAPRSMAQRIEAAHCDAVALGRL